MEGIQILNTYQIQSSWSFSIGLLLTIGMLFSVICGVYAIASEKIRILIIAFIIGIPSYYFGFNIPAEMITRYEVVYDESATMNFITEKYNVIEQRGDIWVLEEKSDE